MVAPSEFPPFPTAGLSAALRGVRVLRGLSTTQIATLMGMNRRTYERFENGRMPIRLDRLHRFAVVTDSDLPALLTAALTEQPSLAAWAANNKMSQVQAWCLKRFSVDVGAGMLDLDALTIMAAADKMYDELKKHLQARKEVLGRIASGMFSSGDV